MKLSKPLHIDFQSLVLIILIPILTLIIALMAWLNYSELHDTILNGFKQKLIGISTTSGAFINGDEHAELTQAREMKAFAYVSENNFYGVDKNNNLVHIDLEDGAGVLIAHLPYEINDLSYNPHDSLLYATAGKKIISIHPKSTKTQTVYEAPISLTALAYDPLKKQFLASSENNLYSIDANNKAKHLHTLEFPLSSLAYDTQTDILYALEDDSGTFISLEDKDFKRSKLLYKAFPIDSSPLGALAFNEGKLYAGSQHLIIHDLKTRTSTYEDFARGYRNEKSELYKKYIEPMTKIKIETGLTYHYTQNLVYNTEGVNCIYILDVHDGNEYTPIGSEDEMDKEDLLGAENVMLRKEIYISKVKQWEQWGLLKVSFAPIYNTDGDVKAIAGADINMGIIKKKTKEALFLSIAVGFISLLIALIAAYFISQKIIHPIKRLKYSALRIAAGRYGDKVVVKNPRELSELSTTFNVMDEELKSTISSLTQYNSDIQVQRREQDLQRELDQRIKIQHPKLRSHVGECSHYIDGILLFENTLFFWFSSHPFSTAFEASKKRELISATLKALIKNTQDPLDELHELFTDLLESFGSIDLQKNLIMLHEKSESLDFISVNKDKTFKIDNLKEGQRDIDAPLVFAEKALLESLDDESVNLLLQQKYSHLKLRHCSLLYAVLPKEEL